MKKLSQYFCYINLQRGLIYILAVWLLFSLNSANADNDLETIKKSVITFHLEGKPDTTCTGLVIKNNQILTAAHCMENLAIGQIISVIEENKTKTSAKISNRFFNAQYFNGLSDIAILVTEEPLKAEVVDENIFASLKVESQSHGCIDYITSFIEEFNDSANINVITFGGTSEMNTLFLDKNHYSFYFPSSYSDEGQKPTYTASASFGTFKKSPINGSALKECVNVTYNDEEFSTAIIENEMIKPNNKCSNTNQLKFSHESDIAIKGGDSGSPVFMCGSDNEACSLIGVFTGGESKATSNMQAYGDITPLITPEAFDIFNNTGEWESLELWVY